MADLLTGVIVAAIVLAGTAIGIGGTLFVQLRMERERQKFEREKLEHERQKDIKRKKAEKLEELSALLYDAQFHIDLFEGRLKSGQSWDAVIQKMPPHLFGRIVAISNLYFPEFISLVDKLMELSGDYLIRVNDDPKEDLETLYEQVSKAWGELATAVRAYARAKREFQ